MDWSEDDYFMAVTNFRLTERAPDCTVVGFHARNGEPLFAKTDDIKRSELGMNVQETTVPDRGYSHVHFHFACSIWTVAGMNEHGLAMGMTGIPGPVTDATGLFSLDALHSILPVCATVEEAISHIQALPLNCGGFSLTLADSTESLAQVEKSGAGLAVLPMPADGAFLHGNTIVDPEFTTKNPQQATALVENSNRRMHNAGRLLAALPRTEDGLCTLFQDSSPEGGIRQGGADGMFTDFWVLFSAVDKRFRYGAGWPDYRDEGTVRTASLFGTGP
jgi:hypothetical protein